MKKIFYLLFTCCILLSGCDAQSDGARSAEGLSPVVINGKTVMAEVADSPDERRLGLMFRTSLEPDQGMLFVFEDERILSFWMKNTRIPLSLAYISKDGVISQIIDMEPYDERSHRSKEKVKYALEVNQGWFKEHGIQTGDRVELPEIKH